MADFYPGYEHIADPLIDYSDYGMKATTVRALFAQLRRELVPIGASHHLPATCRRFVPEAALPPG